MTSQLIPSLCKYIRYPPVVKAASSSSVTYFQGQKCGDTGRREYFYYVDHQGMVSLQQAYIAYSLFC